MFERRSRGILSARWCPEHVVLACDYIECRGRRFEDSHTRSIFVFLVLMSGSVRRRIRLFSLQGGHAIHWRTTSESGSLQAADWVEALRRAISGNSRSCSEAVLMQEGGDIEVSPALSHRSLDGTITYTDDVLHVGGLVGAMALSHHVHT